MDTAEINTKKAIWVIKNKLRIEDSDKIIETSIENLVGDKFELAATLSNRHIRKAVTGDKELAEVIFSQLVKLQSKVRK